MKYAKPYSRSFDVAHVTAEDGPVALEVIEALLVFAQRDTNYVLQIREQIAPLKDAIDVGQAKSIARAILATIRSVSKFGPDSADKKWINDIRRFWEAVETREKCLRGLDAILVLARGNHPLEGHCEKLARDARAHRDAIVGVTHREPKREVRTARSWAKREAREIEYAAMMYWSDGEPLAPDWELLGEPRPTPRTRVVTSSKFPLPWET